MKMQSHTVESWFTDLIPMEGGKSLSKLRFEVAATVNGVNTSAQASLILEEVAEGEVPVYDWTATASDGTALVYPHTKGRGYWVGCKPGTLTLEDLEVKFLTTNKGKLVARVTHIHNITFTPQPRAAEALGLRRGVAKLKVAEPRGETPAPADDDDLI